MYSGKHKAGVRSLCAGFLGAALFFSPPCSAADSSPVEAISRDVLFHLHTRRLTREEPVKDSAPGPAKGYVLHPPVLAAPPPAPPETETVIVSAATETVAETETVIVPALPVQAVASVPLRVAGRDIAPPPPPLPPVPQGYDTGPPPPASTRALPVLKQGSQFSLGGELAYDWYRELDANIGLVVKEAVYGGNASYLYRDAGSRFYTVEGRLTKGHEHYQSISGTLDGTPAYEGELRVMGGKDFSADGSVISPYTGLGARVYYDLGKGRLSSLGLRSYDRRIAQLYLPLGATWRVVAGRWVVASNLEFDQLIKGWVNSRLGNVGRYDVMNKQTDGSGLRGEVMFSRNGTDPGFSFGPFFRYWDIDDSDLDTTPDGIRWMEPHNTRFQMGVALRWLFR